METNKERKEPKRGYFVKLKNSDLRKFKSNPKGRIADKTHISNIANGMMKFGLTEFQTIVKDENGLNTIADGNCRSKAMEEINSKELITRYYAPSYNGKLDKAFISANKIVPVSPLVIQEQFIKAKQKNIPLTFLSAGQTRDLQKICEFENGYKFIKNCLVANQIKYTVFLSTLKNTIRILELRKISDRVAEKLMAVFMRESNKDINYLGRNIKKIATKQSITKLLNNQIKIRQL